jgi:hypothetical protein
LHHSASASLFALSRQERGNMAGHKFSGYISNIWQALFAAFTRLLTHVSHFSSSNNTTSKQRPDFAAAAAPAPVSGTDSEERQLSSASTARPLPANLSDVNSPLDLEKGQPPLSPPLQEHPDQYQQQQEHQDRDDNIMAAAKKRGGHKRSSVKPNGPQPVDATITDASDIQQRDKENMVHAKQTSQSIVSVAPIENKKAHLDTSNQTNAIDARSSPQLSESQKQNGATVPSKGTARSATTQMSDGMELGVVALDRVIPKHAGSQASKTTAIRPAEHSEVQNAGSHSQRGTQNHGYTADDNASVAINGVVPVSTVVDQAVATFIGKLALDDNTPGPEKPLTKDMAAVEAAGVPIVVVNSTSSQPPIPLKPLAPLVTPPSQVLPGLIEPDTEEGKKERAIHLNFMREALKMVSQSISHHAKHQYSKLRYSSPPKGSGGY